MGSGLFNDRIDGTDELAHVLGLVQVPTTEGAGQGIDNDPDRGQSVMLSEIGYLALANAASSWCSWR